MSGERYVVLGLAPARSAWFEAVSQWATSAAIPAEFVKCVSAEEVQARLAAGRVYSALLIDAASPALDRDLVDLCGRHAVSVIAVSSGRHPSIPTEIGVAAHLPAPFSPADLLDALASACQPVGTGAVVPPVLEDAAPSSFWQAPLVVVAGPGGTGSSTVAIALASGLSQDPRFGGRVLLADLARRADQAMLHDSPELGPGVQELVDAHRLGRPSPEEVIGHTFAVPKRGYSLLLGLRAAESWAALRPRSVDAALSGLRRSFQAVVADVTGDFEGEAQGGSLDVEERNHLARAAALQATVNVAVGGPGIKGIHSLALLVGQMVRAGADPQRMVAAINRAPRNPRARAESSRALATLLHSSGIELALAGPVHLPERRVDDALRDGEPLPRALVEPITAAVRAVADRLADAAPPETGPARITPGSLGTWSGDAELEA